MPHDVAEETQLSEQLRSWLAFSDQKAVEVRTLASYLADPASAKAAIDEISVDRITVPTAMNSELPSERI